jgi:DNA-binding XRE family transcriptional regulator
VTSPEPAVDQISHDVPQPVVPAGGENGHVSVAAGQVSLAEELRARHGELGRALKSARQAAGLAQRELARKVGYSRSAVANAETGANRYSCRFWVLCDEVLKTSGTLLSGYNQARALRIRHLIESSPAPMSSSVPVIPVPEDFRITVVIRCTGSSLYVESVSAKGLADPVTS